MLRVKLKGTTLVETLAASIIVAIAFGIGTIIYLNVLNAGKSVLAAQAEILVQSEMCNSFANRIFENTEIKKENVVLVKTLEKYTLTDVYIFKVSAFQKNKKLAEVKRLVLIK